jgi:hypothetical protein
LLSTLSAYVGRYYFGASLSTSDRQSVARSVFGGTGLNVTKEKGRVIVDPIAGGPAEEAGVLKGDLLTAVATDALSLGEIISKLGRERTPPSQRDGRSEGGRGPAHRNARCGRQLMQALLPPSGNRSDIGAPAPDGNGHRAS